MEPQAREHLLDAPRGALGCAEYPVGPMHRAGTLSFAITSSESLADLGIRLTGSGRVTLVEGAAVDDEKLSTRL